MFTSIVTILYDIYAFLFSVDIRVHDCTFSKRYKLIHMLAEGFITMFWWASLSAVATAMDGMLIDGNGTLLVRRQDSGMWKPDSSTTGNTWTDPSTTTTTAPQPQTTTTTTSSGSSDLAMYETAARSKGMVVGSVACAGLVGYVHSAANI